MGGCCGCGRNTKRPNDRRSAGTVPPASCRRRSASTPCLRTRCTVVDAGLRRHNGRGHGRRVPPAVFIPDDTSATMRDVFSHSAGDAVLGSGLRAGDGEIEGRHHLAVRRVVVHFLDVGEAARRQRLPAAGCAPRCSGCAARAIAPRCATRRRRSACRPGFRSGAESSAARPRSECAPVAAPGLSRRRGTQWGPNPGARPAMPWRPAACGRPPAGAAPTLRAVSRLSEPGWR